MRILIIAACACLLAACSTDGTAPAANTSATANIGTPSSSGSWDWLFSAGGDEAVDTAGPQLGVNAFLWRATLDTLNFMPLTSGDPVGGVVITDWYSAPETPNDRMKVTAYILDRRLRADALKVAVFRQARTANGWVDAAVNPDTPVRLENAILTRARELHLASLQ